MSPEEIERRLKLVEAVSAEDQPHRHLLLASLISELFAEIGHQLIVVGGSAVEIYTDGRYVSKDIDFARVAYQASEKAPEIMASIGAVPFGLKPGNPVPLGWRPYLIKRFSTTIDLCDTVDISDATRASGVSYVKVQTPCGDVLVYPPEELIAERLYLSISPSLSPDRYLTATVLLESYLEGRIPSRERPNLHALHDVAADSAYCVEKELAACRKEIFTKQESQ